MSERGVFAVDRGIWDHDLLSDSEPFSRREAWLWLVSEAAWKPHRRRILGRPIDLERGQLVASTRFIASKWRWSEPRVRRFLIALISEGMVGAKTDAGINVITICRYDEYQRVSLPRDASPESDGDAGATQERRKEEDREYKEISPSLRSGDAHKTEKVSRGSRLAEDWRPDEAGRQLAVDQLGSIEAARAEFQKFQNHWMAKAGRDAIKLDWKRTWQNWIMNAHKPRAGPPRDTGTSFREIADSIRGSIDESITTGFIASAAAEERSRDGELNFDG